MKKLILVIVVGLSLVSTLSADVACNVTSSKPIYKSINVRTPHTESYQIKVDERVQCGYTYQEENKGDLGLDTLIGAGIGGILGHQIGSGTGKAIATGAGTLFGGYTANQMRDGNYHKVPKYCNESHYKKRYRTTYTYDTVNEVIGYKNYFIYNDKEYVKTSDRKLKTVIVRTSISY